MKKQDMLKFFISIAIIILFSVKNYSQTENDSVIIKNKYGIRIGLDFSKQIRMLTEDYKGLSLYGDVKIKERLFIVSELGSDEKDLRTENLRSKFSGNYIKVGFNYNLYNNLPGFAGLWDYVASERKQAQFRAANKFRGSRSERMGFRCHCS